MDATTFGGQQSGLYNDQLAPVFSGFQLHPPSSLQPVFGQGAGPMTLPAAGIGGSASPASVGSSGAVTPMATSPATSGTALGPLGIPSVAWWIVGAFAIGYIVLWKIHFRK